MAGFKTYRRPSRRQFLQNSLFAGYLAGAGAQVTACSGRSDGGPPNVVVFLADDQAVGDLGFYGNTVARTPHTDAFARQSVELSRFYVSPVCAPTRASLLTGRWSFRMGVTNVTPGAYEMDGEEITLAEALRGAGYSTAVFGKWHVGEETPHQPGAQGFEKSLIHRGVGLGKHYYDPLLLRNGREVQCEGYCQDIWTREAVRYLRERKADGRPFFLYLPSNLIHEPLLPENRHAESYRNTGIASTTGQTYAMQNSLDDGFGRVLAELNDLGLEHNTLVLYTSDNGPQGRWCEDRFPAGLHGIKGSVYENGIRVPCFMRWPDGNLRAGHEVGRIAAHIDILPTILDACGVTAPSGVELDGVSILPLLKGETPEPEWPDRNLYFQWDARDDPERGMCFTVFNQRYKLVQARGNARTRIHTQYTDFCKWHGYEGRTMAGPPQYELFDIENDRGELADIAPRYPEMVERMRAEYDAWFDEVWAGRKI